jgi:hypothetical protein
VSMHPGYNRLHRTTDNMLQTRAYTHLLAARHAPGVPGFCFFHPLNPVNPGPAASEKALLCTRNTTFKT